MCHFHVFLGRMVVMPVLAGDLTGAVSPPVGPEHSPGGALGAMRPGGL